MPEQVISPRIRGFLCLNAHPAGCAANVAQQIDLARQSCPVKALSGYWWSAAAPAMAYPA